MRETPFHPVGLRKSVEVHLTSEACSIWRNPRPGIDLRSRIGYDVIRILLGLILLTAAALKGHELVTGPTANQGLLTSRWFLITLVECEFVFGLWLLSGLYPIPTRRLALLCFGTFSLVTLYKALSGAESCGCFGKLPVNPWVTFVLDASAVAALLKFRPSCTHHSRGRFPRLRLATVAVLALGIGTPLGLAMTSYTPAAVTAEGEIIGESKFVVLNPEAWRGKRFPLLRYIDIGNQLAAGTWLVVLYHHDCPDCREAIPKYEQMAQDIAGQPDILRIALIEMPPYADTVHSPVSRDTPCTLGQLNGAKEWFVTTPAAALLSNGSVKRAWEKTPPTDLGIIFEQM
jgi:thiol-disulfide isomerase/thioredoxin